MASDRDESHLVVVLSCVLAIAGVMMMRINLHLDLRLWAFAYVTVALTASIRRTSRGTNVSTWSAIRGLLCLMLGLFLTDKMGYRSVPLASAQLLPDEFLTALHWIE